MNTSYKKYKINCINLSRNCINLGKACQYVKRYLNIELSIDNYVFPYYTTCSFKKENITLVIPNDVRFYLVEERRKQLMEESNVKKSSRNNSRKT
jgi:hypothetical protein